MIGTDAYWRFKLHAFLHDPPEKALVLGTGHEARGRELSERLAGPCPEDWWKVIKQADRMASAADRANFLRDARWSFKDRPILRHPLSGDEIDLAAYGGKLSDLSLDDVRADVDAAIAEIQKIGDGDPRRTFLALWRLLPEKLRRAERTRSKLGDLVEYLPAETRMPDHSILEHQAVTAAVAGGLRCGGNAGLALLLFSIGPVQGFVASARRAADFWAGSFLLSRLAASAIRPLLLELGPDAFLFPFLRENPEIDRLLREDPIRLPIDAGHNDRARIASLPNRFFAIVPASHVEDLADKALRSARGELEHLGEEALDRAREKGLGLDEEDIEKARAQIHRQPEIYWVSRALSMDFDTAREDLEQFFGGALPPVLNAFLGACKDLAKAKHAYNLKPGSLYGAAFEACDATLAGRKRLRDFPPSEEGGLKCSVCGTREVLGGKGEFRGARDRWNDLDAGVRLGIGLKRGERLCAVCLLKRQLPAVLREEGSAAQPSTGSVAVAPFKKEVMEREGAWSVLRRDVQVLVKRVRAARDTGNLLGYAPQALLWLADHVGSADHDLAKDFARLDGDLLLAAREPETAVEDYPQDVLDAAADLVRTAARNGVPPPSSYLTMVHMDGDHMGQWISGARGPSLRQSLASEELLPASSTDGSALFDPRTRRPLAPAIHAAVSRACGNFAVRAVPKILSHHEICGHAVYAGGDDLLAFVPVSYAIEAARELRLEFSGHVEERNGRVDKGFEYGRGFSRSQDWRPFLAMGTTATASGAIVVFHYTEALTLAIEEAHGALAFAKDTLGRNALAISILRRSGEITRTGARWTVPDRGGENGGASRPLVDVARNLQELVRGFQTGDVPSGLPYALRQGLGRLAEGAGHLPAEAYLAIARRALDKMKVKDPARTADALQGLLEATTTEARAFHPGRWLDLILAAGFLARGGRL